MTETPPDGRASELTRRAIDTGNSRDFDAMVECFGENAVVDLGAFGLGVHVGRSAIRRFLIDWIGSCDEVEFQVEKVGEPDPSVAWALVHQRARPAGTTRSLSLKYTAVYQWDGDLALRAAHYPDVASARAAAEALAGDAETVPSGSGDEG